MNPVGITGLYAVVIPARGRAFPYAPTSGKTVQQIIQEVLNSLELPKATPFKVDIERSGRGRGWDVDDLMRKLTAHRDEWDDLKRLSNLYGPSRLGSRLAAPMAFIDALDGGELNKDDERDTERRLFSVIDLKPESKTGSSTSAQGL